MANIINAENIQSFLSGIQVIRSTVPIKAFDLAGFDSTYSYWTSSEWTLGRHVYIYIYISSSDQGAFLKPFLIYKYKLEQTK